MAKHFFALEVAMAVACGTTFLSFRAPKPAKLLYIDGEMPANVMQERLIQIKNRLGVVEEWIEPLIITPDLQDTFMPDLSTYEGQEAIEETLQDIELIIVDNLSTLAGSGKENEADSWFLMQKWALNQRRQGKSVMFIHHAGKSGSQRGTSKREDTLDTVIAL
ncbi:MAG: helicase RepA family protein, partial [Silvanigrellaceae bacterium]|nr:helicase RepA family protein [Silvanigrellaceae bacterium]